MKLKIFSFIFLMFFQGQSLAGEIALPLGMGPLEEWMREPERTPEEALVATEKLVSKYLQDERYQEAIWALRFNGQWNEAEKLEDQLEEKMLKEDLIFVKQYSRLNSVDEAIQLSVGVNPKLFVIAKAMGGSAIENEVLAYELSKKLELDLVPKTVFRKIDGVAYSLQYFMRDVWKNPEHRGKAVDFRGRYYPDEKKNMWLLDYLIGNTDRHGLNWFRRYGNIDVAIDHGHAFGRVTSSPPKFNSNMLPEGKLLQKIIDLNPEDFSEFEQEKVDYIFEKRAVILRIATERNPDLACRIPLAS